MLELPQSCRICIHLTVRCSRPRDAGTFRKIDATLSEHRQRAGWWRSSFVPCWLDLVAGELFVLSAFRVSPGPGSKFGFHRSTARKNQKTPTINCQSEIRGKRSSSSSCIGILSESAHQPRETQTMRQMSLLSRGCNHRSELPHWPDAATQVRPLSALRLCLLSSGHPRLCECSRAKSEKRPR